MIVATSQNHVIGLKNKLPWHLPKDLQHFKKVTWGHPVIMGRKTFHSLGIYKPLPHRTNIVLSRNVNSIVPGCILVSSVTQAIQAAKETQAKEAFVIGGNEIYQEFYSSIHRLYLTQVHDNFEGDTFLFPFNFTEWTLLSEQHYEKDEKHSHAFTISIFEK